jgi:beta-glucanase (GH16 family)
MNVYKGGPYQQAASALTNLNNNWYDGNEYQVYAFEYTPGSSGDIAWFIGDTPTWRITGDAIGPNGNVGQRVIPEEPMSIIMNFGMASGFSALNLTGIAPLLPATLRFDYIRIYQDPNSESVTCDPSGWETTQYINDHYDVYSNPNATQW